VQHGIEGMLHGLVRAESCTTRFGHLKQPQEV